jgi:D-tyrosyl-tRNA(Tyr) deacylase
MLPSLFFACFVDTLRQLGAHVETGIFGEMMEVSLTNDGPVTFVLEA